MIFLTVLLLSFTANFKSDLALSILLRLAGFGLGLGFGIGRTLLRFAGSEGLRFMVMLPPGGCALGVTLGMVARECSGKQKAGYKQSTSIGIYTWYKVM